MKILIGVDDSSYSRMAVDFVLRMTWPAETRFLVLSVSPTPVLAYSEAFAPGSSYDERIVEDQLALHRRIADEAAGKLRAAALTAEARAVVGDPRLEILETARTAGTDLIVVGSHGRTGLAKLVMGSVAAHVSTHAPCSVLVVKDRTA